MKKLDFRVPSAGGNHNTLEGDDKNNQGSSFTKQSQQLGTLSEKQSLSSLRTGPLKSTCGSIIKITKNELDETELLQIENLQIQSRVDSKDKQTIPSHQLQLNSQQKKRGIRVQSNHQFPSDFFSNQICKTETSMISRQLTSQPINSQISSNNRLPQFQTSSNPMKQSLPLPTDQQIRCQNEKQDLSFDQLPSSKNNHLNNSSSKGYIIRQMYPQNNNMHQYAQSFSSINNGQQNIHISNNNNGKIDKNSAPISQLNPNNPNRILSPKERPWRILSPKDGTSIMVSPRLRPLRILSPKEGLSGCLTSPKSSLIPNIQKPILKPYLGQTSNTEDISSYSSDSLEKSKPHERQQEQQQAAFFIQKQNSCKIGLGGKRIMSMIDSKPSEKGQIFNEPQQSKLQLQDTNKNLNTNSIVPSISRQNLLSGKGAKPNPVDFTNFKMPLSSIGKKIKNFSIPEKSNKMKSNNLDQQLQKSFGAEESVPKLQDCFKGETNDKNSDKMNLLQSKIQPINEDITNLNTNFFSQITSESPFPIINNSNGGFETIEEDFQIEDSDEKQYFQQQNQHFQDNNNKQPPTDIIENKTADFSSGWNNNNNNNSNKKDQPRLAVNSKISDKYKPFLIRQVSSQSSQRAQQSASISTNSSATAASLTMFCSDLIKNSDAIQKNPSLTAQSQLSQQQQQPILNSIECFNSHEFSFSNS